MQLAVLFCSLYCLLVHVAYILCVYFVDIFVTVIPCILQICKELNANSDSGVLHPT